MQIEDFSINGNKLKKIMTTDILHKLIDIMFPSESERNQNYSNLKEFTRIYVEQMTFLKKYLPKLKKKNGILVIEDVRDYSWMSGRSTHERIKIFQSLIPEHLSNSTFVEDLIEKDNRWDSLLIYIKT